LLLLLLLLLLPLLLCSVAGVPRQPHAHALVDAAHDH
jgi:hypothetical protein